MSDFKSKDFYYEALSSLVLAFLAGVISEIEFRDLSRKFFKDKWSANL